MSEITVTKGDTPTYIIEATKGAHNFNLDDYKVYFKIVGTDKMVMGNKTRPRQGVVKFTLDRNITNLTPGVYDYIIRAVSQEETRTLKQDQICIRGV